MRTDEAIVTDVGKGDQVRQSTVVVVAAVLIIAVGTAFEHLIVL